MESNEDTMYNSEIKKSIVLQNILFPKYGICSETDLYYRGRQDSYSYSIKGIVSKENETFSFDTYFNGFSAKKWNKYTNLGDLILKLDYEGSFKLIIMNSVRNSDRTVEETPIGEFYLESKDRTSQSVVIEKQTKGILSFKIISLQDGSCFYGGDYSTILRKDDFKQINLAINICTYRREDYVELNLNNITNLLLSDPYIKTRLHIYISDNGNTLDTESMSNSNVHVVRNKNTGGSGGFTRGLLEGMNSGRNHTHYLFMDDDIVFEPESIYRTLSLLSILRDEYSDAFLGGTMLRMDKQTIIHESGSLWRNGRISSLKQGVDVSSIEGCLYNEVEESHEYHAWWYCTIPAKFVNRDNLPIPLFIKADDIEYSLRNMENLILINGISVWHEPFDWKYSPYVHYYITRNRLITNSVSRRSNLKETIHQLKGEWAREMFLYRYDNAELILRGAEDFLKGVDHFKAIDAVSLHKEIMDATYKMEDIENLNCPFSYHMFNQSLHENVRRRPTIEKYTFNGALIPVKKRGLKVVHAFNANTSFCFGCREILSYDYVNEKGFCTKINTNRMLQCITN